MKKNLLIFLLIAVMAVVLTAGCGSQEEATETDAEKAEAVETGTLEMDYNMNESPKEGLISKDGWLIKFDHIYMTLANVKAYQTDPPYSPMDAESEFNPVEEVSFEGLYNIDLAQSDDPVVLAAANDVPVGHYNAVSWDNVQTQDGEYAGYSIVLIGQASKDGEEVAFNLKFDPQYKYLGGEYVGDERKGFVQAGETADVEMTFHFDHFFGDSNKPADCKINTLRAVGFDFFNRFAENGEVNLDMAQMKELLTDEEVNKIVGSLKCLAHSGGAPVKKEMY